ncbi:hypothetical protein EON65_58955, partial [archaeon]
SRPSGQPSSQPTMQPSRQPSSQPSSRPSRQPSPQPSSQPSNQPTFSPFAKPSTLPSSQPSGKPTVQPSSKPTNNPSAQPSNKPSSQPTYAPSQPSSRPSTQPSSQPSSMPSSQPSSQPTTEPTRPKSLDPTSQPSCQPSSQPSSQPSVAPSAITLNSIWYHVSAGLSSYLYRGSTCISSTECILVGAASTDGVFSVTINRGLTWTNTILSSTTLNDVAGYSDAGGSQYYIAVAETTGIFVSTDMGSSFTKVSNANYNLFGVGISQNGVAFVVGYSCTVYRSTAANSFATWSSLPCAATSKDLYDTASIDGLTVYIVGQTGTMYKSTDGGTGWTALTSGTTNNLYAISLASNQVGMVLGANNYV